MNNRPALLLDNGGSSLKIGFAGNNSTPRIVPNCLSKVKSERRRMFIGDQIDECKDYGSLFYIRPISHGYITHFDTQRQIWEFVLRTRLNLDLRPGELDEQQMIITQPYFNFRPVQQNLYEVMF